MPLFNDIVYIDNINAIKNLRRHANDDYYDDTAIYLMKLISLKYAFIFLHVGHQ